MVRDIQGKLLGAELMSKLKKVPLDGIDFAKAKGLAVAAVEAVRTGKLGYALVVGQRASDGPAIGREAEVPGLDEA